MKRRGNSSPTQDTVYIDIELNCKEHGKLSCKYLNRLYACLIIFHHLTFTLSFRFADVKVNTHASQNCQLLTLGQNVVELFGFSSEIITLNPPGTANN